jgi:pteridine reductase
MTRANLHPIALITGAARRIGAQIASTLHSSGFDVVIHYRRSEAEARTLCAELNQVRPDSAHPLGADLTRAQGCRALIAQALAWRGRLDALVNNASSFGRTPIGDINEDQWAELVDGNLKAAFFCSQYAAPALKASRGAIVNVCDVHTERPLPQFSVYTAAKAGIVSLTRSFALELAPDVRVNAVSPGSLTWPEDATFSDAERVRIESSIPLARIGDGLDIGVAVRFLLREAHYVTGQVLAVDGGAGIVSS